MDALLFSELLERDEIKHRFQMKDDIAHEEVVIIGAGPVGLACALALQGESIPSLILEKGAVADAIQRFPPSMTFFSTPELLELDNVPFITREMRPTRYEAVKYYSRLADAQGLSIRRYCEVTEVRSLASGFRIETKREETLFAKQVIIATGYYDRPNKLEIPGEDLPHVKHYYDEGLRYSQMNVAVVGGQNSACEAALDLYRSGARVTLIHRRETLGESVKYWVRPDIENRLKKREIRAYFGSEVESIHEGYVRTKTGLKSENIPADFVFLLTGYHPDTELLSKAGVKVNPVSLIPEFHPETFETNVPQLYVAGSITAGRKTSNIFIENGRMHAQAIARHISQQASRSENPQV